MEMWRIVPSKKGVIASSFGRVMLPARVAGMPNGGVRKYIPKPVYGSTARARKNSRHSYKKIQSSRLGPMKVHRLVCEAFHGPEPADKPIVIHIDENSHNNRPENLRWGTQKENLNMPKFIEYCKSRTGSNSPRAIWKKRIENERGANDGSAKR